MLYTITQNPDEILWTPTDLLHYYQYLNTLRYGAGVTRTYPVFGHISELNIEEKTKK